MSSQWSNPPAPPLMSPHDLTKSCAFCGDPIEVDEPCLELFYGVLGRGRAGFLMVVDASSEPEPSVTLHTRCIVDYALDNIDDSMPDSWDQNTENCEHCGSKLDPRFCPSCGMKQEDG